MATNSQQPAIQMQPMASTNILQAGYDPKARTLAVEFVGGGLYYHYQVPEEVWAGLRSAASAGRYYRMVIKDRFRFERMD
jgi:hypothetical protein